METTYSTNTYRVTHYPVSADTLIISFLSAGRGMDQQVEEFRGTLNKFNVSMAFVDDRFRHWYNAPDTPEMFHALEELVNRYPNVGALGESLGGCGAILSRHLCPHVSRSLSFAPQFSIKPPFIGFDERYKRIGESRIPLFLRDDFIGDHARDEAQILFGNTEWRDYIHMSMYRLYGFPITIVDGASHQVATWLKHSGNNKLVQLAARLCDFSVPFRRDVVQEVVGDQMTADALRGDSRSLDYLPWDPDTGQPVAPPR